MKIGIAGFGKMGKEIFSLLFGKLPDAEFTVITRSGAEEKTDGVMRSLGKRLKRKMLTVEQYEFKKGSFLFTDDISKLKDCDAVIESICEDMEAKKEFFARAAQAVSDDCLLLTNTSSLDISSVFEGIPHRERCFGMHFFFPVRLTDFTELNLLPENPREYTERAEYIIRAAGKRPVIFTEGYHMYLNQMIACTVSHAIYLRELLGASVRELDYSLRELFPAAAPFEMLDSIGPGLMSGSSGSFIAERNRALLGYGTERIRKWLAEGCPEGTGSFLSFMAEREDAGTADLSKAPLYMTALILNETVNAAKEYNKDIPTLLDAVQDVLGLAEAPARYCGYCGTDRLFAALDELYGRTGFSSYKRPDREIWDRILN